MQSKHEHEKVHGRNAKLNCIYFNARSLTIRADEVRTDQHMEYDIVAVTEVELRAGLATQHSRV